MSIVELQTYKNLTKGAKAIIEESIRELDSFNEHDICEKVSSKLEDKYSGQCLEYQLNRMGLSTIKDVMNAVDSYIFKYGANIAYNKQTKKRKK